LGYLGVDERIILKWMFKIIGYEVLKGLIAGMVEMRNACRSLV
jgi:uncharacterized protein YrrD